MTGRYWNVERQPNRVGLPWFEREHTDWEVRGAAGERIRVNTDRWCPLDELDAIAQALNALPEYRTGWWWRGSGWMMETFKWTTKTL